jgi:hypothetical protein
MIVVTHFSAPCAKDGVCTSLEPKAGVQFVIVEELTKAEKKEVFFKPCFSCFLLSLSSPIAVTGRHVGLYSTPLHKKKNTAV